MRAGNLDREILIETHISVQDPGSGESISTWVPLANVRAQVVQSSTEEFFRDGGVQSEVAVVFRTRYVAGVTSQSRILYEGRHFNIAEIKELGRRRGLEFRAASAD